MYTEQEKYYKIIQNGKPKLKFCEWFDDKSPIWNYRRHNHPFLELMYFYKGQGGLNASGTKMSVSLFETIIYPAGLDHQESPASDGVREIICIWVDLPELKLHEPLQIHDRDNAHGDLFKMIYREAKRDNRDNFVLECQLKLLLSMLLRSQGEDAGQKKELTLALQYIHNHYTEKISIEQLAKIEHISKSYLARLFKQKTGMTAVSYIHQLRIEAAKRLLKESELNINEVAYQVGFESPKYFYRSFTRLVKQSPSNFRKEMHKKPAHDGA